MKKPVVILGVGIGGLSVARELVKRGDTHLVVLGRSGIDRCASAVAMGVSAVKGMYAAETGLFQDKLNGHNALRKILTDLDIPIKAVVAEPFIDKAYYEYLSERVFRRQFTAQWGVKRLHAESFESVLPGVFHRDVLGALTYPNDYWFDPSAALAAMRLNLEKQGVRFIDGEMVSLSENGGEWSIGTENGWSCTTHRIIVASGVSLEEHASRLGFAAGKWKKSNGLTVHATLAMPQEIPWVLLHKTASIGASGHSVWMGPLKEGETASSALTLWASYLNQFTSDLLRKSNWLVREGVRMRVQELHHRPFSAIKITGEKACAILGGFHKSGWQLAPIYAERLVSEWFEKVRSET